ncbi:hypothetical protein KP509_06G081500 [Ceratopteris richardii]|uniref:C3H1-type domain-containing protein n=1 Tax=Ceratopteris richardii TaxID=49495 RepID=A0A8T2UI41_CERRI|nr:hypothetical protein KP509_06G081500 [Ceratopteris richardii]
MDNIGDTLKQTKGTQLVRRGQALNSVNQGMASGTSDISTGCAATTDPEEVSSKPIARPIYEGVGRSLVLHAAPSATRDTINEAIRNREEVFILTDSPGATLTYDERTCRSGNVSQTFLSTSISTRMQEHRYENGGEASCASSLISDDKAGPCANCISYTMQKNISLKPYTDQPCTSIITSSNNYVFLSRHFNNQYKSLSSNENIKIIDEASNATAPAVRTALIQPADFQHPPPYFEEVACELAWNDSRSILHVQRCELMEQHSRHVLDRLSHMAECSSLNVWDPRNRGLDDGSDRHVVNSYADHKAGFSGMNKGPPMPTLFWKVHERYSPAFNVPKCISIRADGYCQQQTGSRAPSSPDGILTPLKCDDIHIHGHNDGTTMDEVSTHMRQNRKTCLGVVKAAQVKLVALAEDLACFAFPQGMYKTEMCNKWINSMGQYCPYGEKCQFAHGPQELRPVLRHHRYKTILCRMVAAGEPCPYEHRCHFRHIMYPHEAGLVESTSSMR